MPASTDPTRFRHILTRNVVVPLALTVLTAALFIALIAYLIQAMRWVEHTDQVIARTYALETLDLDMEAGLRGFLLSGDDQFLEPYERGGLAIVPARDRLRQLVADNPEQLERLDRVQNLQERWNDYAAQQIAQKRRGGADQVAARADVGRRLKEAVRAEFDQFVDLEDRLRRQRTEAANTNSQLAVAAFVALVLLVGGLLAWRGRRDLLGLAGRFEGVLNRQHQQAEALQAQAWLRDGQTRLSERLARESSTEGIGRAALEELARTLDMAVGAVYAARDGGFTRIATWGWPAEAAAAGERLPADRTLVAECATQRRQVALHEVPAGYLQVSSSLGEAAARAVLLAPIEHEDRVAGVLELGFLRPLAARDGELVAAIGAVFGASIEAADYRKRLQDALEETQQLNEELQTQQEELRTANQELAEQSRALRDSQDHLESQQAELEQNNLQLADQARRLENQRNELQLAQRALQDRAAELQRASRYKSEFLANMSHELRTPLNSSLILAKLLADNVEGNLSEEQVRFAQSIHGAGNDLLNLINDILDIAKVEAGRLDMRAELTPVAALAEGLRTMFQPLAARKGLQLDVQVAADAPSTLYTDRQRLEQVLRNLVANAIKFTERGTVSLQVARRGGDALAFEVRDSGIGIAPDQQELIFEAFRQADGTVSRRFGGTGLGLSISRDLVRLLGGSISVASTPGQGSVFTVVVPLEYQAQRALAPMALAPAAPAQPQFLPAARAPVAPPPADAPAAAPAFPDDRGLAAEGRRTVLVIEDDAAFARILFELAHELGYRCLVAHQADEGVALAQAQAPDAVLLDMRLPDDSGLAVLQRLKENGRTRHLPVHVISVTDRVEMAMHLGAIGYARKPATREELQQVFARLESKLDQKLKRVLLVEDDPRQQDSVARLIGDSDVEIVAVAQGSQALEALAGSVFDVMIIDLALPDMSGQELLRRMVSGDSRSFPPVIVYTGPNLSRDEEAELMRYSRSIIIKGVRSPERLLDEVTLFLHQVEHQLSAERQQMLRTARNRDKVFEGRRILLVDDDMRNIFALTSALELKGASVETARNGLQALEKLRADPEGIDLVLMDIMMPEMDGHAATREIRKDPRWPKLPVIAVTAKATKEDQQRCLDAGANDYLAKPIDLERLFSLLRVWMPKMERL